MANIHHYVLPLVCCKVDVLIQATAKQFLKYRIGVQDGGGILFKDL